MNESPSPSDQGKTIVVYKSTFERDFDNQDRDRWPSRASFYLAAIGSAVGFGNIWRFPALAKDYGGGAFFIPYVLAFVLIGLPVLILEISLGQVHQTGNMGVFGRIHPRYRGIGVMSAAAAFMLVVFYTMLLGWVTHAFFDSFSNEAPWAEEGVTGEDAVTYFYNEIIGMGTLTNDNLRANRIVWANVGYAAINWLFIWGSLAFGLMWTGRLTYFTMGLPIVLLFLFVGKAVTLTGSSKGINEYIGKWEVSVLTEQPAVWSTAVSQIFFSIGVTFGIMTAYGSHCPRGEPATINAVVIGTANCMFSFLGGFAVFAALGHLSYIQDVEVDDLPYASIGLTFGTWPVVFGTFPGGKHWVRLLFFDLFLLGIDSAFSLLESPITCTMDYVAKRKLPFAKWQVTTVYAIFGFLLSIMYVNFYIDYILLIIGFLEAFGAGWIYGIEDQITRYGRWPVCTYMLANFTSVLCACVVWFGTSGGNEVWGGFVALFSIYFAGLGTTTFLLRPIAKKHRVSQWALLSDLAWGNVEALRREIEVYTGFLPFTWAFMMKQIIPQVLLILFVNLTAARTEDGKLLLGNYEGLVTWPYQVVGLLCLAFVVILGLVGAVMPSMYEGMDLVVESDEVVNEDEDKEDMSTEDSDFKEDLEIQRGGRVF